MAEWRQLAGEPEWEGCVISRAQAPADDLKFLRRISKVLEDFGDSFIAFDRGWRVVDCNPLAAAYFGFRRESVLDVHLWDLDQRFRGSTLQAFLEDAIAAGTALKRDITSPVAPERWLGLRAFPAEQGVGLIFRDITEGRDRLLRQRQQSEHLELTLAASGLGGFAWSAATDMMNLSPRAAEILGMPPGESISWTDILTVMVHAEDRERAREAARASVGGHAAFDVEFRIRRRDNGEPRWIMVRAHAQYGDADQPLGMMGVVGDITRAKADEALVHAERARLAESEARFRAMADGAPAIIWVTNVDGQIEFANLAFCQLAGMTREEVLGDSWMPLLHPDDVERVARSRQAARAVLGPNHWEARFRVANGDWRWMRSASQPRFDPSGAFRGYVGVAFDVTDAHRAEERQQLLINELNHRVKNTLATIQSLARQSLRVGVTIHEGRERLTERLLALAAAHDVLTRGNWEGADLSEIAREAVRPYEEPGAPRILLDGPPARVPPNVALSLSMALHELATNAVKYGALSVPDGRIHLDWELEPSGQAMQLRWRESGGPPVTAPPNQGFGTRLLSSLAGEFGAPAELRYAPSGVTCDLRAPLM